MIQYQVFIWTFGMLEVSRISCVIDSNFWNSMLNADLAMFMENKMTIWILVQWNLIPGWELAIFGAGRTGMVMNSDKSHSIGVQQRIFSANALLCRRTIAIYTAIHKLLYTSVKSFKKHTKGIRNQMNQAKKICTINSINRIDCNLANSHQIENYDINF